MRNAPVTVEMLFENLDVTFDGDDVLYSRIIELRAKITELETEHARAQALTAELKSKLHEVDFIVERLRIEGKGPPGQKGERGRDGREGPPGVRGERGERGERGLPAPVIAAWEARPERFEIVPVFSNGEKGPPIALLALFQAYDGAVSEIEDADLVEAARASRAATEAETEASRWAK